MSERGSLGGTLGTLKTAYDLAKDLFELRDATARQAKVIELQKQIVAAQESAVAAQIAHAEQLQRMHELEAEINRLKAWEADKQRYRLEELPPGVFVFALKPDMAAGEPIHRICQTCYQRGKKSILHSDEPTNGIYHLSCSECETKLRVGRFRPPDTARPSYGPGRGGGPNSWMGA